MKSDFFSVPVALLRRQKEETEVNLPVLSHTFLSNYENCPRKAWHMYVAKDLPKTDPTPEMLEGIRVHEAFEKALKAGKPETAPHPIMAAVLFNPVAGVLKVEWSIAISRYGGPVDFWHEDAWFRGKVDVAEIGVQVAAIYDWKTGKPREEPAELERFALLVQANFPQIEKLAGRYAWLKEDRFGPIHDLSDTASTWEALQAVDAELRARPIDREWEPTPSGLCPWCPVTSCPHWREKR